MWLSHKSRGHAARTGNTLKRLVLVTREHYATEHSISNATHTALRRTRSDLHFRKR